MFQVHLFMFVSDLRQVDVFLRVLLFPPPNKTDPHDITEILLKAVLNNINQPKPNHLFIVFGYNLNNLG